MFLTFPHPGDNIRMPWPCFLVFLEVVLDTIRPTRYHVTWCFSCSQNIHSFRLKMLLFIPPFSKLNLTWASLPGRSWHYLQHKRSAACTDVGSFSGYFLPGATSHCSELLQMTKLILEGCQPRLLQELWLTTVLARLKEDQFKQRQKSERYAQNGNPQEKPILR